MSVQVLLDPTMFYWSDSLFDLSNWLYEVEYIIPTSIREISSHFSMSESYSDIRQLFNIYYFNELIQLLMELASILKEHPVNESNELLSEINFALQDLKPYGQIFDIPSEFKKRLTMFFSYLIWPNRRVLITNSSSELVSGLIQIEKLVNAINKPENYGLFEWLNFQAGHGDIHHITPEIMLYLTQFDNISGFLGEMHSHIAYKELCKSRLAFQNEIKSEVIGKEIEYITKGSIKFLHEVSGIESIFLRTKDDHNVIKRMGPIKRFQYYFGKKIKDYKEKEKRQKVSEGLKLILSAYSSIKGLPTSFLSKGFSLTIEYYEELKDWSRISGALRSVAESSEKEKITWRRNIRNYITEEDPSKKPQYRPEKLKDLVKSLRSWYNDPLVIESSINEEEASILGRLSSQYDANTIKKIQDNDLITSLKNFLAKENIYGKGEPIIPFLKPWYGKGFIRRSQ